MSIFLFPRLEDNNRKLTREKEEGTKDRDFKAKELEELKTR